MNDTIQEIARGLHKCAIIYNRDVREEAAGIYAELFGYAGAADIAVAFDQHLLDPQRGRWFPTPSDIVHQLTKTYSEDAAHVWDRYLVNNGMTSDMTAKRICDSLGGWARIGQAHTHRDLPYLRREFIDRYSQQIIYAKASRMIGHDEQHKLLAAE